MTFFTFGPTDGSSDIVTGGSFGLEGSLVTSAVLLVLVLGAVAYYRRCASRRRGLRA